MLLRLIKIINIIVEINQSLSRRRQGDGMINPKSRNLESSSSSSSSSRIPIVFTIRLTEQISSIGLFAVTESQCTEDEDDDEYGDDSSNLEFRLTMSRAPRVLRP